MNNFLQKLQNTKQFSPLTIQLVRFLSQKSGEKNPVVLTATTLTAQGILSGHTCCDLTDDNTKQKLFELSEQKIKEEKLREILIKSPLVNDYTDSPPQPDDNRPLVLEGSRLYLRRYRQYETDIAENIKKRLQIQRKDRDFSALKPIFSKFFPNKNTQTDWQKIACCLSLFSPFFILTGGPGTGKTTTVVKMLALLQTNAFLQGKKPLQIALTAPTGKAAARLQEAIRNQLANLPEDKLPWEKSWDELFATKATTLHRLLKMQFLTKEMRHNAKNPLPYDVVLVDEASMLDLELLHALLTATPMETKLILLGDKNQLASIEAGYVLGSLCSRAEDGHYTPETCQNLQAICDETIPKNLQDLNGTDLDQSTVLLRKSYRFQDKSGIGEAANALQKKEISQTENLTADNFLHFFDNFSDLSLFVEEKATQTQLINFVLQQYESYIVKLQNSPQDPDTWAKELLQELKTFQLLTPLHDGEWSVNEINRRITIAFQKKMNIKESTWFHGRPLLITGNRPQLKLLNGERGIVLMCEQNGEQKLQAAFADEETGKIRWISPRRLGAVETAFALTVHKTQGSEFDRCSLVLPPYPSQVLSRELLYTAITRAKKHFSLFLPQKSVLSYTLNKKLVRTSGLAYKINSVFTDKYFLESN